jgi:hypothetical protein
VFIPEKSLIMSVAVALLCGATPSPAAAQARQPGPYEILPFNDAYIVEAFTDLLPNSSSIADWTGWTSSSWVSPNAYNNHGGTDFSVGTGTPCFAITTGTVIEVVNNIPENNHSLNSYGNYVKIKPDGKSPLGEDLTVLTAHMLPTILVNVGDRVVAGQQIGQTDNTGNSTSEHCHVESALFSSGVIECAFYNAHYKYPIMLNPTASKRVGHVLRVTANSTPVRTDRFDTSGAITNVHKDQLLYASFAKRGYYRVFIPNNATVRSGWVRATDVDDVLTGTVIQPLPDPGAYVHTQQLTTRYPIYDSVDGSKTPSIIGYINWAGGRFVADQAFSTPVALGTFYRIPLPDASTAKWGWVKADNRMVVYPQLVNPTINLAAVPNDQFPMQNSFSTLGPLDYGRPKFDRRSVVTFSPPSPTGDGKALLLTDHGNTGNGVYETVSYGRPEHTDYYAQADVYLQYRPTYFPGSGTPYERYGVFLRDDGFGGWDETFEGAGNCYAMMYDSRTGRLWCGKNIDGVETDFASPAITITTDGWRRMRIEASGTQIRYYLDNALQVQASDTTFFSGLCGMGYTARLGAYPSARGAYFDNFKADLLPPAAVSDWALYAK